MFFLWRAMRELKGTPENLTTATDVLSVSVVDTQANIGIRTEGGNGVDPSSSIDSSSRPVGSDRFQVKLRETGARCQEYER